MPISTPTTQPKQSALYARQLTEKEADNLRALERFFNQEATTIASGDRGEAMELGPSGLASFRNLSIFAPAVLPRLKADPDNDAYEQEADQVAENIVESTSAAPENAVPAAPTPVIQRQEAEPEEREEEEEETRQAKAQPGKVIDINGKNLPHIRQLQGKGQQLPNELQAFFQPHFGIDLSQVRIHYDSGANAAAKAINARAFTVGRDVVFDAGQFNPHDRESRKLLAHELAHVAQQSRSGFGEAGVLPVQQKGGTWGGFWRNIGRAIWSIFGDEKAFDDKEIEDYLDYLKKGEIEDDYISDDKARAVVRRWQAGKLELTRPLKVLLIREMFSGPTLNADENAILDILNGSPGERTYLLNKIKPDEFREEFHGREKDELEKILTAWEERTGKVTPLNLDPTDTIRYSKTRILGDDAFLKAAKSLMGVAGISIPPYEGMTVQEFDLYIRRQADWFVEPSIQNDATARDQLWEIAAFIHEGQHISRLLGKLKVKDVAQATPDEMSALRAYAEGAKTDAQTVKITRPHDDFAEVAKWGKALIELKTFVPGAVLKLVFDQDFLGQLIISNLIPELKKYYTTFTPTLETRKEQGFLISLLNEGISLYLPLKDWIHDLHMFHHDARKRLLLNIQDTGRSKPVLLFLISTVDHSAAFFGWTALKDAIKNTKNLALVIQGEPTLSALTARVRTVARDYGQIRPPSRKAKLGQVVIAGHGQPFSIEQTASATPLPNQERDYVLYDEEPLKVGKSGGDSDKLVDTLLELLDPSDAKIVFAGCTVGSHEIPLDTELKGSPSEAAANIKQALKAKPNLRDLVEKRAAALGISVDVQAANATTYAKTFKLDSNGKAILHLPEDPSIGKSKKDYVQTGTEPQGALRAALETWADSSLGPGWTTNAMRTAVASYSGDTDWWKSLTRTVYEIALPPSPADVHPLVLNWLSHLVDPWFLMGWNTYAKADSNANAETVAFFIDKANGLKTWPSDPASFPVADKVYPVMEVSNYAGSRPHLKVVLYHAWMEADNSKTTQFLDAVRATSLKGEELFKFFKMNLLAKHFPTLLKKPGAGPPPAAQLKLAFTIASSMEAGMPAPVKEFLRDAAGNATTSSFPATLNVTNYIEPSEELSILENIGLAPGVSKEEATPTGSGSGSGSSTSGARPSGTKANVDIDDNKKNESYIAVKAQIINLTADAPVWEKPDPNSNVLTTLKKGTKVRVAGSSGGWAAIDWNGKVAFIDLTLVSK